VSTTDLDPTPLFARFADGGRVHVLRHRLHFASDSLGRDLSELTLVEWANGREWALCGEIAPTPSPAYGVSAFADTDLCRSCARLWPHDQALLFEHPTTQETP
jgi:hypothetical protein